MTTNIQWKKLATHDGSAAEVPAFVKALVGGDVDKQNLNLEELFINEGQTCSAAGPTLGLLLSGWSSAARPEWVLRAAANIAGADLLYAWLRPPSDVPDEVGRVLQEYRGQLWEALAHPSPEVRSAAAFVLGGAPDSLAEEAAGRLVQRLEAEIEPQVIASCLLALSRFEVAPTVREVLERFVSAPTRLVRGAWGVAQLRMGGSISDAAIATAVVDWLAAFGEVSPNGFWWWAPTIRFSTLNTFFEKRVHHGIWLAEMAMAGYGSSDGTPAGTDNSKQWTEFMLSVPSKTEEGWAYRGASDFLTYFHGTIRLASGDVMMPEQLSPDQRALATRLEHSPLCAEAGHGLPACGAVRSRWLGKSERSVMEQLLVATKSDPNGKPGKVPLYWAWSRVVMGSPTIPEMDALEGFDRWRLLVARAFGEYSQEWLPPELSEIDACVDQACADPRMAETLALLVDECAARVLEFRRQRLTPKYWAISTLLLVRPLKKHGIPWKAEWESLISMQGDPEAWVREVIEWVPADVRERWLWDNLQRMRFEIHYVDLLPSARLVKRTLLSIHNTRTAGRQLLASTLQLEQAIHELAKTNAVFAQAVQELHAEVGAS